MKYRQDYFNKVTVKSSRVFSSYLKFIDATDMNLLDGSILDIGCATGEFLEMLPNRAQKFGVDISPYAIEKCKKTIPHGAFQVCDLNKGDVPFETSFDIITMFDVIEHLYNFDHLFRVLQTKLVSGGHLILTTPNANALQRYIDQNSSTGEHDMTHTLLFTPYTLDFFLRRAGLMRRVLCTPYSFHFKCNLMTRTLLFGGQIFSIYQKV